MDLLKEPFLCRASGAGSLMTDPKKMTDTLSKTTITFLNDWMKEQIYGYRKNISTKQIEKGIEYEDAAIEAVIDWCDLPFVVKKNFIKRPDNHSKKFRKFIHDSINRYYEENTSM